MSAKRQKADILIRSLMSANDPEWASMRPPTLAQQRSRKSFSEPLPLRINRRSRIRARRTANDPQPDLPSAFTAQSLGASRVLISANEVARERAGRNRAHEYDQQKAGH